MFLKTLTIVAILIMTVRGSLTSRERCNRQKPHYINYNRHDCDSILGVQPWKSCCHPVMDDAEGSGDMQSSYNSGVYTIQTGTFTKADAYCDMDTERGGWMTILRRTKSTNSIDFDRFQDDYLDGFGKLTGDFWLGLRTMHLLTKNGDCEMRVDLYDRNNTNVAHIYYNLFKVDGYPGFQLHLGGFRPSNISLTDSLRQFSGRTFTVSTHEQDEEQDTMCAHGRGGWWYREKVCSQQGSVLTKKADDLEWWVIDGEGETQRQKYHKYEMKIRPQTCMKTLPNLMP